MMPCVCVRACVRGCVAACATAAQGQANGKSGDYANTGKKCGSAYVPDFGSGCCCCYCWHHHQPLLLTHCRFPRFWCAATGSPCTFRVAIFQLCPAPNSQLAGGDLGTCAPWQPCCRCCCSAAAPALLATETWRPIMAMMRTPGPPAAALIDGLQCVEHASAKAAVKLQWPALVLCGCVCHMCVCVCVVCVRLCMCACACCAHVCVRVHV